MSQPPVPLNADQQRELVTRIGQVLGSVVPPGWRQLRIEPTHIQLIALQHDGAILRAPRAQRDPPKRRLQPPARPYRGPPARLVGEQMQPHPEALRLLGMLRSGMYQPARGTWLGAILVFDPARPPGVDYLLPEVEPPWRQRPPAMGFQDELRFFPRADENIPGWLRLQAGLSAPAAPDGAMRTPRIYDGLDAQGRPLVRRPPLAPGERDQVLAYLDAAPVVLAARSNGDDAFVPGRTDVVPLNFRTDGSWVWPGAVAYYLREHDVPPDPELLAHLRSRRFIVPEVDEAARDKALAAVTAPA